jgi:hypothetical protein
VKLVLSVSEVSRGVLNGEYTYLMVNKKRFGSRDSGALYPTLSCTGGGRRANLFFRLTKRFNLLRKMGKKKHGSETLKYPQHMKRMAIHRYQQRGSA